jgi:hypothetical protein
MVEVVRRRPRGEAERIHHRLSAEGQQKTRNYQTEVTTNPTRTVTCVHFSGSQNQWGGNANAGQSRGDDPDKY